MHGLRHSQIRCISIPLSERRQQNSSECPFEAQAAVFALRREKVVSLREADI